MGVKILLLRERDHRIRQLDFTSSATLLRFENRKDFRLKNITPRDCQIRRRRPLLRLFNHLCNCKCAVLILDAANAILMRIAIRHFVNRDEIAAMTFVGVDHARQTRLFAVMEHIGQQQRKRLITNNVARAPDGMAETERRLLAREARLAGLGQIVCESFELLDLAAFSQRAIKLEMHVKMIFDDSLATACDKNEMLNARRTRLIDDMLDHGTVDHRQHLFRYGLGGRQKAGAKPGNGEHGLTDLAAHRTLQSLFPAHRSGLFRLFGAGPRSRQARPELDGINANSTFTGDERKPGCVTLDPAMIVRILLACLCLMAPLSGFAIAKPAAPAQTQQGGGFQTWVEQTLWPAARAKGINRAIFDQAMAGVTLDPAIIALTKKQSEFVKPVWSYLEGAVGSSRIAQGEARARDYASLLDRISEKTGVDPYIVLAIWGIETSFGSATGSKDIIRSLATLAYERYRGEFFRDELIEAMAILQQGHVRRSAMKGSWAGAMGHTQFMPSTFRQYAVDGNGDGKRDIWNDPVDALASTAHYLKEKGWVRDLPWGYEVTLPKAFDYRNRRGTFSQFARVGVKRTDGGALGGSAEASLFLPAGAEGPAFLITANYAAIKAYNASDAYALAVAHLADRIAGGPAIQGVWPKHEKPMGLNERMAIQKKLKSLGYDVGEPDGRFGSKTREALIAFQEKNGLRPDGYPNTATVQKLLK